MPTEKDLKCVTLALMATTDGVCSRRIVRLALLAVPAIQTKARNAYASLPTEESQFIILHSNVIWLVYDWTVHSFVQEL